MTQRLTTQPSTTGGHRRNWRRPLIVSLAACTALCLLVPRPGYGDAGGTGVPDPGVPPVASVPINPAGGAPNGLPTTAAPIAGPLAAQVQSMNDQAEAIGEQLKQLQIILQQEHEAVSGLYQAWQQADRLARYLRERADNAAGQAYKQAESLGPFSAYANSLHQLGMLAPGFTTGVPDGGPNAAQDADRAEQTARQGQAAYQTALTNLTSQDQQAQTLQAQYNQMTTQLNLLRSQNTTELAREQARQDALDLQTALQYGVGSSVNGMHAAPKAQAAVRFALSKVDKAWYLFGAEGPNFYDCSGLTFDSYRRTGSPDAPPSINIPRTAHEQQHALTPVASLGELLPGDLIFYTAGPTTDWRQVSHVAMYIGDQHMVEAASAGEPVKISPVRFRNLFGLARVVPAVPDTPNPTPAPPAGSPPSSPRPPVQASPPPTLHPSPKPSPTPAPGPSSSTPVSGTGDSSGPPPSDPPSANPPAVETTDSSTPTGG